MSSVLHYAMWSSVVNLHPDRTKKTIELIDAALRLANSVEMRLKHALACRRPNEFCVSSATHHSDAGARYASQRARDENYMVARILWEICGKGNINIGTQLMRQATRIAVSNRTVAGVHFPVDTAAGQVLGLTLGRYFSQRAQGGQQFGAWRFDGERFPKDQDFIFQHFSYDPATDTETMAPYVDPLYVELARVTATGKVTHP